MNRRRFGLFGLTVFGLERKAGAQGRESLQTQAWAEDLATFFGTRLPRDLPSSEIGAARISARQKLAEWALPAVATLIAADSDDYLNLLWWQHTNRSVRAAVVAIFLCRRSEPKSAEVDDTLLHFETFASRFKEGERAERLEEIKHVRQHRVLYAGKLGEMTKGIERAVALNRAFIEVAAGGSK